MALHERARTAVDELLDSGVVLEYPRAQDYVAGILARILPSRLPDDFKPEVLILRSADAQAWAYAQGTIALSVGMLFVLETEAQLAQVLGHEVGHVVERHGLESVRTRRRTGIASGLVDLVTLDMGGVLVSAPGALSLLGYSRRQELEADAFGLTRMIEAGYVVEEASLAYHRLIDNRALPQSAEEQSLTHTHPTTLARIENIEQLINEGKVATRPGGERGRKQHRGVQRGLVNEYLRLLLLDERYDQLLRETEQWVNAPRVPAVVHCERGEAQRRLAKDPDALAFELARREGEDVDEAMLEQARVPDRRDERLGAAEVEFERCLAIDPDSHRAQRGVGLLALDQGREAPGRLALERYLELHPRALDRRYVRGLLAAPTKAAETE